MYENDAGTSFNRGLGNGMGIGCGCVLAIVIVFLGLIFLGALAGT